MKKELPLLILAVIAISVSIGIAFIYENIYVGFYSILLFSVLFLIALDRILITTLNSKNKKALRIFIGLFAFITFGNAFLHLQKAYFQEEVLINIRQTFDTGITKSEVHQVALSTMRNYQYPTDNEVLNVRQTFTNLYEDRIDSMGNFKPISLEDPKGDGNEDFIFKVLFIDENIVQIRVISKVGLGESADFENANGLKGRLQSLTTITENGVSYEREN